MSEHEEELERLRREVQLLKVIGLIFQFVIPIIAVIILLIKYGV